MSAWGKGGSLRSCDSLLKRVEQNDATLIDLVILPMKTFGATEARRLANCLASGVNTNLKSISASGHALPPDVLELLGNSLSGCNVASLMIGDNSMGDVGVASLCKGLGTSCKLEAIDLSWKNIGADGIASIVGTLGQWKSLHTLILARNNSIGKFDFSASVDPIFSSVKHLDLSECRIDSSCCRGLAGRLNDSSELELNLGSNDQLGSDCLSALMTLSIKSLRLPNCSIGDEGMKIIVDHSPRQLNILDVSNNGIGPAGINYMSEMLEAEKLNLSQLTELNLARNKLDEECVSGLAHALSNARSKDKISLSRLDMTNTSCGTKGAMDLIQQSSLHELVVFNNQLGSDGFVALATCLAGGHPTLSIVDVGGNEATEAGVVALLRPLTQKSPQFENVLTLIVVGGNASGAEVEEVCKEIKAVHPELDIARDKPKKRSQGR